MTPEKPITEEFPYKARDISRLSGVQSQRVDYLTRLGLVSPVMHLEGGRLTRRYGEYELDLFKKAGVLLNSGVTPREIIPLLHPTENNQALLTEKEVEVLKKRFLPPSPPPLELIGEELGMSRQVAHELEKSGTRKLVRHFLLKQEFSSKPLDDEAINELVQSRQRHNERHETVEIHPLCPCCDKPGDFIRRQGAYTRVWSIFKCPIGNEFTYG